MPNLKTFEKIVSVYSNWPTVVAYRYGMINGEMVIHARDGSRIAIRSQKDQAADLYVANEAWVYDIHDGLLPYLKNAKVGIDLGGHIGTFSLWAARRTPARIITCEPDPANLAVLHKNITANTLEQKISVIPCVITPTTGFVDFHFMENAGMNSIAPPDRPDAGAIRSISKMATLSLPDLFAREKIDMCDFMKVDIEGGEYDVFMSLPDEIYGKIRAMSIEIENTGTGLIEHIVSKGFSVSNPHPDIGGNYLFENKNLLKRSV